MTSATPTTTTDAEPCHWSSYGQRPALLTIDAAGQGRLMILTDGGPALAVLSADELRDLAGWLPQAVARADRRAGRAEAPRLVRASPSSEAAA